MPLLLPLLGCKTKRATEAQTQEASSLGKIILSFSKCHSHEMTTLQSAFSSPLFFFLLAEGCACAAPDPGPGSSSSAEGFPGERSGEPCERSCPGTEGSPTKPSAQPGNTGREFHPNAIKTLTFCCQRLAIANGSCDICITPVTTWQCKNVGRACERGVGVGGGGSMMDVSQLSNS